MPKKNKRPTRRKITAKVRPLSPDDPQSIDHPSHDEQWLDLARALGSAQADRDFDNAQRKRRRDD